MILVVLAIGRRSSALRSYSTRPVSGCMTTQAAADGSGGADTARAGTHSSSANRSEKSRYFINSTTLQDGAIMRDARRFIYCCACR